MMSINYTSTNIERQYKRSKKALPDDSGITVADEGNTEIKKIGLWTLINVFVDFSQFCFG